MIGSTGSVIPCFIKSLMEDKEVKVTDPAMTRFWITIESAITYMIETFPKCSGTSVRIPTIKAASVVRVARAVADCLGIDQYKTTLIGMRPGEKMHEVLISSHAGGRSSLDSIQYDDTELRAMIQPFVNDYVGSVK